MYILTEKGTVEEGLQLTPVEAEIFKELANTGTLNHVVSAYISSRDAEKLASFLVANYILVRRVRVEASQSVSKIETFQYDSSSESDSENESTLTPMPDPITEVTIENTFPGFAQP